MFKETDGAVSLLLASISNNYSDSHHACNLSHQSYVRDSACRLMVNL